MIKKRSYFILIVLAILSLIIIGCLPNYSRASDPINNPEAFNPSQVNPGALNVVTDKANTIVGAVVTVGTVVSVVTMLVLGIKYMVGSVEEKAEYKKSMMPYLIGAVFLFSCSAIVNIIASIVKNSELGK